MREDRADDVRFLDEGDESAPSAAVGTQQDVDAERAPHEIGPGSARFDRSRTAAARLIGLVVGLDVGHDVVAPGSSGCEDAVIRELRLAPRKGRFLPGGGLVVRSVDIGGAENAACSAHPLLS